MNNKMEVSKWVSGHVEGMVEAAHFHKAESVRIGMTGEGIRPNYQLIDGNSNEIAINGINHKPFTRVSEFDRSRISKAYKIKDIANMKVWGGFIEPEDVD